MMDRRRLPSADAQARLWPDGKDTPWDVLVIGGGVNGTAIARDAAGRGLSVCLCEKDDIAAHTSSRSSKLIHGGLRYLEQREFGLVREALTEREVMRKIAPHITRGLPFVLPHEPHLRPAWEIWAGLFLYDHLGRSRRRLPGSRRVRLDRLAAGELLKARYRTGFIYADVQVQDARLSVLNALDAREHGAWILPHARCTQAVRVAPGWTICLKRADGESVTLSARALVNAAGPWVTQVLEESVRGVASHKMLRLVKGSHIVVPRIHAQEVAYTFQLPDRRIVFAIPYQDNYTLIGTTDVEYQGDPSAVRITRDETEYLCAAVNRYFKRQIAVSDVLWCYSGVRPLVQDHEARASEVTREYRLEWDTAGAPIVSVFGGKITMARRLAEEVVDRLGRLLQSPAPPWTARSPLPGGERSDLDAFERELAARYPWLPAGLTHRWVHSYGTRSERIVEHAHSLNDLGLHFGAGLYAAEVRYACAEEWVTEASDLLWRRSKLGLRLQDAEVEYLQAYLEQYWLHRKPARLRMAHNEGG